MHQTLVGAISAESAQYPNTTLTHMCTFIQNIQR